MRIYSYIWELTVIYSICSLHGIILMKCHARWQLSMLGVQEMGLGNAITSSSAHCTLTVEKYLFIFYLIYLKHFYCIPTTAQDTYLTKGLTKINF